jgi:hypothetical protein
MYSIVCREYFSIIFDVKKCTLYLIKYGMLRCPVDLPGNANLMGRLSTAELLNKVPCFVNKVNGIYQLLFSQKSS